MELGLISAVKGIAEQRHFKVAMWRRIWWVLPVSRWMAKHWLLAGPEGFIEGSGGFAGEG